MALLFRPSERDRQALQQTVRSLREATVPALAAALSWRPRKVERLLVDELTRSGTSMAYDPARRVVRWAPPVSIVWSDPPPTATAPTPRARVDLGPTLAAPPPVLRAGGLKAQCPSCHVPLVAASSPSLNVCPDCGRLFSSRTATSSAAPPASPPAETPASPAAPAAGRTAGPSYGDRRSQELLAAYVTASPIPCPRCRTSMRHRGVSEYACPSCGETVHFGPSGSGLPAVSIGRASSPPRPSA